MSKKQWLGAGMMFLGACFAQAAGCSSSSNNDGGTGGAKECCACTLIEGDPNAPACTASRTVKPAGGDTSKCSTFCATVGLTCSGGAASKSFRR